ncbi:micronuclear linker histone polyprotein-like [Saccostrea echinata]|uniref:micronuclear linker histone polyprotein-like n=1 Tax=Saccostrea echinata TaxID=191078 RepID=UPI002A7F5E37|nr:micronuclear linker histone polyprotein-like [Saccostrea echinata]
MSLISFLRCVKQSNIPKALTVFQKTTSTHANNNTFKTLTVNSSSSSHIEQFKCILPSENLFSIVSQRGAATTKALTSKKSSSIEITVPEPPKRPSSSYLLFFKDHHDQVQAELDADMGERAPSTQVMAHIGKLWKSLPKSEAQVYKDKAKQLSEEYQRKKVAWKEKLTPLQEEVIRQQKMDHDQTIKERKLKKLFEETEKPKRPKRAQAINLMDIADIESSLEDGDGNQKEKFTKYIHAKTEKWKSLPEEEKEALRELAREQNKQAESNYHKKLAEWVLSMYDEDMLDVVTKDEAKIVLHQLNMPKRRKTALQIFQMSDLGKEMGVTVATAKTMFESLPSGQKEHFNNLSKNDKKRAEREFEEWMDGLKERNLGGYAKALVKKSRAIKSSSEKVVKEEKTSKKKTKATKGKSKKKVEKSSAKKK